MREDVINYRCHVLILLHEDAVTVSTVRRVHTNHQNMFYDLRTAGARRCSVRAPSGFGNRWRSIENSDVMITGPTESKH